ncbi:MAG TPA: nucleotidyltransferase family protein [Candidatus Sulfotelmatobacter sp.]|nr:nucleotidyltransferase family protein [Candidatus Sulfotelmatobacter sp.]
MAMRNMTALVLCGGKGERLRPLTSEIPKALAPLRGRPILQHLLTYLAGSGIRKFVLCVGYQATLIEQFVETVRRPDWDIRCMDSGDASMNDRILDACELIPERVLICYGDTLANVDLAALESLHAKSGVPATMTVYPLRSAFGIVEFNENALVTGIVEKPLLPYWVNIGFVLCEPCAFEYMERNSNIVEFCSALSRAGCLAAYKHVGQHVTINTARDLAEAQVVDFATVGE